MQLLLQALLMGCFGWLLIWILLKSITYPKKPVKIGGCLWKNGIQQLLQKGSIRSFISVEQQEAHFDQLEPMIEEQLNVFLKTRLAEKLPMISMFIGEQTIQQLKTVFLEELRLLFPNLMDQMILQMEQDFAHKLSLRIDAVITPALSKLSQKLGFYAFIAFFGWTLVTSLIIKLFLG